MVYEVEVSPGHTREQDMKAKALGLHFTNKLSSTSNGEEARQSCPTFPPSFLFFFTLTMANTS